MQAPFMPGITDLQTLLETLQPVFDDHDYVFVSRPGKRMADAMDLPALAAMEEPEGLTLVVKKEDADTAGIEYESIFRMITLRVHSSLEAVGLTAAIATALAEQGISANVIAGFYHDHIFVPSVRAHDAICVLENVKSLSTQLRAD
ncbi:hypothetical protein RBWH47_00910 [Rhodopirellula baltica WH47]|uniref:DUF2241 domain-containing protein n=2 Tax=Rhodopirellula baltica TaxID=265606 RepID=F2AQF7_RHOBT|nr:hypothetical protein RBWH47_00910 [Rhodopirellula baltica WH47]